jgi:hypothetical protein
VDSSFRRGPDGQVSSDTVYLLLTPSKPPSETRQDAPRRVLCAALDVVVVVLVRRLAHRGAQAQHIGPPALFGQLPKGTGKLLTQVLDFTFEMVEVCEQGIRWWPVNGLPVACRRLLMARRRLLALTGVCHLWHIVRQGHLPHAVHLDAWKRAPLQPSPDRVSTEAQPRRRLSDGDRWWPVDSPGSLGYGVRSIALYYCDESQVVPETVSLPASARCQPTWRFACPVERWHIRC